MRIRRVSDKRRLVSTVANLVNAHTEGVPWEILLVFQPGPQFQRVRRADSLKLEHCLIQNGNTKYCL